jgi:Flp pilus assembly pilin Flp
MMTDAIRLVGSRSSASRDTMMHKKASRGALSIEYAVMIVVAVAALVAMSIYLTRAISGRMKASGDVFGGGRQYQY